MSTVCKNPQYQLEECWTTTLVYGFNNYNKRLTSNYSLELKRTVRIHNQNV